MTRLLIDSSMRTACEEPDDYTVTIDDPIKNVKTISLLVADIPFCAPTIGRGNDSLTLTVGSVRHNVTLPHGHIDTVQGIADVVSQLLPPDTSCTVSGGCLRLSNPNDSITVSDATCARVCGLRAAPDSTITSKWDAGAGAHVVEFPYAPQLDPERYLLVHVEGAGGIASPSQDTAGAVAAVKNGTPDIAVPVVSTLDSRLLTKMRVRIIRPQGTPYDFMGRDHLLEFLVE